MKCTLMDAAVAVAAILTPTLSPAIIEEPGHLARFYLDEKCQSVGPGNPSAEGVYYHNDPAQTAEPNAYCDHGHWTRVADV